MFKEDFKNVLANKNLLKQRGQVAVLFAFLIPFFMLFTGLTLDLGWYYLNVSRLQNAADAAALAGAYELNGSSVNNDDGNPFSSYTKVSLVNIGSETEDKNGELKYRYHAQPRNEYERSEEYWELEYFKQIEAMNKIADANDAARTYLVKNLTNKDSNSTYYIYNSWTNGEVQFKEGSLYLEDGNLYFVVEISEEINNLFLSGWFDPMPAPVTAVAKLSTKNFLSDT